MTAAHFKAAYNLEPFRPFVLHLADGRAVPVRHREFVLSLPSGRTVIIAQPDDTFNVVDLLLVTDLEFKVAPAANGKRRGRGRE